MTDTRKPLGEDVIHAEEDMSFQRREWAVQRVGQGLLAVLVGLALTGLLGGEGPANHAVAAAADRSMQVEYERVARQAAPTTVRLQVGGEGGRSCRVSRAWFDAVDVERITPSPAALSIEGDSVVLRFAEPLEPGTQVVFDVSPRWPGRLAGWAALDRRATATFSSFVLL